MTIYPENQFYFPNKKEELQGTKETPKGMWSMPVTATRGGKAVPVALLVRRLQKGGQSKPEARI